LTNCIPFPIFDIILEISSNWVPHGFFHLSLPIWTPLHVDTIAHVTEKRRIDCGVIGINCSGRLCMFSLGVWWGWGGGVVGIRNTTLLTLNNIQSIQEIHYIWTIIFSYGFLFGSVVENNSFFL